MNTRSTQGRTLVIFAAAAAILLGAAAAAFAQPGPGGAFLKRLDLTKEQRAKVRAVLEEHRGELRDKLAGILTEEQLEQFDAMQKNGRGSMWDQRRKGRGQGMKRGRGQSGNCDCCCGGRGGRGGRGHSMRSMGPRGGGPGMGPGPHMGEFREERSQRMVEQLVVVLDLTDDQKEQIEKIVEEHHAQFKDFDRSKLSFEERQQTRESHRQLLHNRIAETLTDDQRAKFDRWIELKPKPRHGRRGGRI